MSATTLTPAQPAPGAPNYHRRKQIGAVLLYLLTIAIMIVIAFPMYWLITTSFKVPADAASNPPTIIPTRFTLDNYVNAFKTAGVPRAFANSIIVALAATFFTTILGSMAAYALAKSYLSYTIRRGLMIWILVTRIFPPVTTAIPYYVIVRNLHLGDTHVALIITYVAYGLPFVIWLMLGFFQDMPAEIEKAAIVDGCSFWQRFRRVILPLALPGLAVTSIFAFIYSWNELLYASMLTSFNAKTIPVVVSGFISDQFLRWGEMTAIGTLMVIPVLIFAAGAQRYLVRGLTFGAVKG
ncbi:MAG: carbohydrate ABC transporter permease [Thermomicrobiales bacterium]|nr:carbohydrate ABC transporter permease [Thermomicrobiales bacterium]